MKPTPGSPKMLPLSNSDPDLLRRHLAGEHAAFHELMMRHYDLVTFVVRSRVDARTAEEIAQAVFLALRERAAEVLARVDTATSPTEELCAWLVSFAQDEATDRNRATRLSRSRPETNPNRTKWPLPNEQPARREPELDALAHCLTRLPAVLREYLAFHYFDGLTPKAIGSLTGKSESYIGRQLKTARGHLSRCVETILNN
jgi:RNA polymerase sigma factor (sigma-70 family)